MKSQLLRCSILLLALSAASCEKIKDLAGKVTGAIESSESSGEKVDPALQALVDETEEGFLFRKDQAFPDRLDVEAMNTLEFQKARIFMKSELGSQGAPLEGVFRIKSRIERAGDHVRVHFLESGMLKPVVSEGKETGEFEAEDPEPAWWHEFHRKDGRWEASPGGDFSRRVVVASLAEGFDGRLAEYAAEPRDLWFGKRRIKVGESLPLEGKAVEMLFGEGTTGAVTLVLEKAEPKGGHPCGRFSIKGQISYKNRTRGDGEVTDAEITIESGSIWLSLVHPCVMGYEFDTVQTMTIGSGGGASTRIQGSIRMTLQNTWKQPAPASAGK